MRVPRTATASWRSRLRGKQGSGLHVALYGSELIDRAGDTRVGARTLTSARESTQVSGVVQLAILT